MPAAHLFSCASAHPHVFEGYLTTLPYCIVVRHFSKAVYSLCPRAFSPLRLWFGPNRSQPISASRKAEKRIARRGHRRSRPAKEGQVNELNEKGTAINRGARSQTKHCGKYLARPFRHMQKANYYVNNQNKYKLLPKRFNTRMCLRLVPLSVRDNCSLTLAGK